MFGPISRRTVISRILPAVVIAAAVPAVARAEEQPQMREALEALREAQRHLVAATPDKGGHRHRALRLVNQAIEQVQRGIAYDNKR